MEEMRLRILEFLFFFLRKLYLIKLKINNRVLHSSNIGELERECNAAFARESAKVFPTRGMNLKEILLKELDREWISKRIP